MEQLKLQVIEPKQKVGLIVVLTGNGKGETTSAMGTVLRAVGYGLKVCIIQFMKGENTQGDRRLQEACTKCGIPHDGKKDFAASRAIRIPAGNTEQMRKKQYSLQRRRCCRVDSISLSSMRSITSSA
jgi:ATP:corrinoid adenosyltransferase